MKIDFLPFDCFSNCSVDPIFQDILSMIEATTVFRFVSVVSGVTMGLGSFVAGDPIGEVAGEVGEGWIPQSWANSSIAWNWPSWFSKIGTQSQSYRYKSLFVSGESVSMS